jgi:hypothetical protein
VVKVSRHVVTQNQVMERKWKSLDQANRKGIMEMGETDLSQEGTDNKETTMEQNSVKRTLYRHRRI